MKMKVPAGIETLSYGGVELDVKDGLVVLPDAIAPDAQHALALFGCVPVEDEDGDDDKPAPVKKTRAKPAAE